MTKKKTVPIELTTEINFQEVLLGSSAKSPTMILTAILPKKYVSMFQNYFTERGKKSEFLIVAIDAYLAASKVQLREDGTFVFINQTALNFEDAGLSDEQRKEKYFGE